MKEREELPPLFWIAMLVLAFMIMKTPNAEAADVKLMIDILECESSGALPK